MTQTKRDIQALLDAEGIRPLKRFGQNFLIDGNIMQMLVTAAELGPQDVVLEVGPGTGGLTDHLVERAGHVVSVEIDHGLARLLARRYEGRENFTLIHRDVLERKNAVATVVLETLQARHAQLGGRLRLVANLPYQVATPLLMNLIISDLPMDTYCFTVQAEVAQRMLAAPGTPEYGPLGILLQACCAVRRLATLGPQVFWPAPQVDSAMMQLIDIGGNNLPIDLRSVLSTWVRRAFNHRRKTLKHTLRQHLEPGHLGQLEGEHRFDLTLRPEAWPLEEWMRFVQIISASHM